jgi:hypothetical protein
MPSLCRPAAVLLPPPVSDDLPAARPRGLDCPACGGGVQRVPRLPEDRVPGAPPSLRRFRCLQKSCSWEGLIERPGSPSHRPEPGLDGDPGSHFGPSEMPQVELLPPEAPEVERERPLRSESTPRKPRSRRRSSLHLLGIGVALAAVALLQSQEGGPGARRLAAADAVPPGQSHDGEELPAGHPWKGQAMNASSDTSASAPDAAGPPWLSLRRDCRWGDPGRNPYRGTVEQALAAARVAPSVADELAARIRARQADERLVIDNRSIRSAQGGARVYAAHGIAMSYGTTMCLGTRVNFKAGHQEAADLYEATDLNGRRIAVMVPDVCGNVSVISAAEDTGGDDPVQQLRAGGLPGSEAARGVLAVADAAPQRLPEPGTLLLLAVAALAVGLVRHGRHATPRSGTGPRPRDGPPS